MFRQSRIVGERLWESFKRNNQDRLLADSTSGCLVFGSGKSLTNSVGDNLIHDSLFELNSFRFHRDLWDAAETDPLTTIYSAVWTLCYTLPPPSGSVIAKNTGATETTAGSIATTTTTTAEKDPKDPIERSLAIEYYINWYPFILLHKYLHELSVRGGRRRGDDTSTATALFDIEQLQQIDRAYLASFEKYRSLSPDEAKRLFESDEETYARSALLAEQIARTPYGCVERSSLTEARYSPLSTLLDPQRLTNMFTRTQHVEPLRKQCEQRLIGIFGLQVRVNSWLLPMMRRNEDTTAFGRKIYNESERQAMEQFVMYWQYQKSEILWFVLHTLFALNDLVADDNLSLDLLFFVSEHLERFIECGICRNHWLNNGKKLWKLYTERYAFSEKSWREQQQYEMSRLENSPQLQNVSRHLRYTRVQSLLDTTLVAPDLFMLQTHNDIQTQNISNTKRLTEATLHSLRNDYRMYAFLLETRAIVRNAAPTSRDAVDRVCAQREDLLVDEFDIFCTSMLRNLLESNNDHQDDQRITGPSVLRAKGNQTITMSSKTTNSKLPNVKSHFAYGAPNTTVTKSVQGGDNVDHLGGNSVNGRVDDGDQLARAIGDVGNRSSHTVALLRRYTLLQEKYAYYNLFTGGINTR